MRDEEQFSFLGRVELLNERIAQCAVTVRYHQWNPEDLSIDLLWLCDEETKREYALELKYLNSFWVQSLDANHSSIELLGITGVTTQAFEDSVHSSRVSVSALKIGITQAQLSDERKINVTVRVQPSGILCLPSIHNRFFTGEVKIKTVETGIVEIDVLGGKLEARETYEYNKHEMYGDIVTEQIQRATLLGEITVNKGQSLSDAHERLKEEIRNACSALSLCYRQTVDFYEIEYSDQNSDLTLRSVFRRKWPTYKRRLSGDELINTRALLDGGLKKLICSIEALDRKEDIHRAIQFLANSYEETAETAYFMAFSAMETIVSCCLDRKDELIAESAQWKKIERTLKEAIQSRLDSQFHEALINKLPELKRQALSARIDAACVKLHPKTDDLWPNLTFKVGIKRAANIRNGLFHSASTNNDSDLISDLVRIRNFSERLLLKLIGWKDEDIWAWSDQQLKRVNSNES